MNLVPIFAKKTSALGVRLRSRARAGAGAAEGGQGFRRAVPLREGRELAEGREGDRGLAELHVVRGPVHRPHRGRADVRWAFDLVLLLQSLCLVLAHRLCRDKLKCALE